MPKPACIKHFLLFAQEITILPEILGYPSLHPSQTVLGMDIKMPVIVRPEASS